MRNTLQAWLRQPRVYRLPFLGLFRNNGITHFQYQAANSSQSILSLFVFWSICFMTPKARRKNRKHRHWWIPYPVANPQATVEAGPWRARCPRHFPSPLTSWGQGRCLRRAPCEASPNPMEFRFQTEINSQALRNVVQQVREPVRCFFCATPGFITQHAGVSWTVTVFIINQVHQSFSPTWISSLTIVKRC